MGAKVPGSELAVVGTFHSSERANWPGSEKARYQNINHNSIMNTAIQTDYQKSFVNQETFLCNDYAEWLSCSNHNNYQYKCI